MGRSQKNVLELMPGLLMARNCCKPLLFKASTHQQHFPPTALAPPPIPATATPADFSAATDIRTMSADELAAWREKKAKKKAQKKKRSKEAKKLKKMQTDSVADWTVECNSASDIPTPGEPSVPPTPTPRQPSTPPTYRRRRGPRKLRN